MRRKALYLFLALLAVSFPLMTSAQLDLGVDRAREAATEAGFNPTTSQTTLAENLGYIVRIALSLLGVIFMVLIVYAGYLWMMARGNETEIEKAQGIIRAAVIGLIIVVSAYSITYFIVPRVIERAAGG